VENQVFLVVMEHQVFQARKDSMDCQAHQVFQVKRVNPDFQDQAFQDLLAQLVSQVNVVFQVYREHQVKLDFQARKENPAFLVLMEPLDQLV